MVARRCRLVHVDCLDSCSSPWPSADWPGPMGCAPTPTRTSSCTRSQPQVTSWLSVGQAALPLSAVVVVALVLRALMFSSEPSLSDDYHRYLWDGRVQQAGINPYLHAPDDPALDAVPYPDRNLINHPDVRTIYPPLSELLFLGMAAGGLGSVAGLKLVLGAFDLGNGRRHRPGDRRRATADRPHRVSVAPPGSPRDMGERSHRRRPRVLHAGRAVGRRPGPRPVSRTRSGGWGGLQARAAGAGDTHTPRHAGPSGAFSAGHGSDIPPALPPLRRGRLLPGLAHPDGRDPGVQQLDLLVARPGHCLTPSPDTCVSGSTSPGRCGSPGSSGAAGAPRRPLRGPSPGPPSCCRSCIPGTGSVPWRLARWPASACRLC